MPRYLIQQSHDPSLLGCQRVFEALAAKGSHFLAYADWGCEVGVHTGWLIVEAEDDADARRMVPPVIRKTASVVRLNRATPERFQADHQTPPRSNLGRRMVSNVPSTEYGEDVMENIAASKSDG